MPINATGLSEREVVGNVITALTSNQMIAPSVWIDPRNSTNYFLTVQYPEQQVKSVNLMGREFDGRDGSRWRVTDDPQGTGMQRPVTMVQVAAALQ